MIDVNIGQAPNDGLGSKLRDAFYIINENFRGLSIPDITGLSASIYNLENTISNFIIDSPNDGSLYGRKSGTWSIIPDGIPLSGTTNPITGNLQFDGNLMLYNTDNITESYITIFPSALQMSHMSMLNSSTSEVLLQDGIIKVNTQDVNGLPLRGLSSDSDYSTNITDLDYTQKKYVDTKVANAIPLNGTTIGNAMSGNFEIKGSDFNITKIFQNDITSGNINTLDFNSDAPSFGLICESLDFSRYSNVNLTGGVLGLQTYDNIITVNTKDGSLGGRGISGVSDYSANITDLDYTQKKYVDDRINISTGGLVSNATHTGDVSGSTVLTLASVNSNIGTFGSTSSSIIQTVNEKGLVISITQSSIQIDQVQVNDLVSNLSSKQEVLVSGLNIKTINGTSLLGSGDLSILMSLVDASETVAGKVSVGTQTFGGNKIIVGESSLVGNAFIVQNSAHTVLAEISNLGDSYFNGVRVGKGKGNLVHNTVLGNTALNNNTTGINATAIGIEALALNTTGNHNTAVGADALYRNTTGGKNTAIGVLPLFNNINGSSNTAIGMYSMYSNISGSLNLSLGDSSLYSNTTGFENTAIGYFAMYSNTTGGENIGIGSSALQSNTTGIRNIGIGLKSGSYIADGTTNNSISDNSIYIGQNTKALANNQTNQIVIGYDATGAGSNTATIGNTSIKKTVLRGVIAHSTNYTVATLPTGALGDTTFVTDAVAPTYLGALTGGGSVACPVFHNGTNWVSH